MQHTSFHGAKLAPLSLAIGLALVTAPALAADSWGTKAEAFSLNCISADCSGGGVSGGDSQFPPAVTNLLSSPATNGVTGTLGTSTVTAAFEDAAPGLATMRQTGEATGGANGIAFGEGNTLDLVSYSGPPTTVTITVDLTGEHTGPTSGADSGIDGIRGVVYVFTNENSIDFIDGEMSPEPSCLFECYVPDATAEVTINDGTAADTETITLELEDGDQFYINGRLNLAGAGGGMATSLNSFTYSFAPTTGLTSLAGGGVGPVDSDGDGLPDSADNCIQTANPSQTDADGDGYGNACDADLNNDDIVNAVDLGLLRVVFFTNDAVADFNEDGVVNVTDLGIMRAGFFLAPGPSAFAP